VGKNKPQRPDAVISRKLKMKLFKQAAKYGAVLATLAVATSNANAAIVLTSITDQFVGSEVVTAVMAVAGTLALIYATMTAAKMALRWIRGG
jgi:hypothetical protein